jgi:hypothetical protein
MNCAHEATTGGDGMETGRGRCLDQGSGKP